MDKIKEYWVIIAFVIALIFAAGNMQQKDKTQDTRITSVEVGVKENTTAIHAEEIRSATQATNQINIMNGLDRLHLRLDSWEPTKTKELK